MKNSLMERIEMEIEREAQRKGVYFPSEESVSVTLELDEDERQQWEDEVCSEIGLSEGYEFEWIYNENTGEYDLLINFSL